MYDVIVLGSLMMDLVARAPRLPLPGESLLGDAFGAFIGGKGCNQAMAARRMGAEVALIGRVGDDDFGRTFLDALAADGVDHTCVSRDSQVGTGVSCVHIGAESGQNTIIATPRANYTLSAEMVTDALASLIPSAHSGAAQRQTVFLMQCETSLEPIATGLRLAKAAGMRTVFNVAPIPRQTSPDELYPMVDVLVVNETEASALAGFAVSSGADARRAADTLLALGPRAVVITLGAQGSLWRGAYPGHAEPVTIETPTFPVTAVDATGAGDAFCGVLASSLAASLPLPDALLRASAAGALAVTRMGAVPSLPTKAEVETLLDGTHSPSV